MTNERPKSGAVAWWLPRLRSLERALMTTGISYAEYRQLKELRALFSGSNTKSSRP